MIDLRRGDMLDVLPAMEADSIHAVVTDPPYHLTGLPTNRLGLKLTGAGNPRTVGFMNKAWDGGDIAFRPETWAAVLRVLRPGGYLLAFGGTRTFHRLACAIEDAGFEMRDTIAWLYGSGFPKSLDISKAIDRAAGAEREVVGVKRNNKADSGTHTYAALGAFQQTATSEITAPATDAARQWSGWGTALKPAMELICVARKPLSERTVAANVLRHGTGGINVDACRIETSDGYTQNAVTQGINTAQTSYAPAVVRRTFEPASLGRWPANVVHDGSADVLRGFPETASGVDRGERGVGGIWSPSSGVPCGPQYGDSGSAARFFYTAKADKGDRADSRHPTVKGDRADSRHPTVKPVDLMRWLVRLVTPPGGTVLDPFAGSGTTGEAAMLEGFDAILIEREAEHAADIAHRQRRWHGGDLPLFVEAAE
jgi:DNA modification methylase